jgi:lipopolysaccharide/colanic/teichoic acid biosynthesis glycosyltransferase
MSLIGARPERPTFVREFVDSIPGYADRHRLPVGVTGWSQINGLRQDTSIAQRARFDNYYIECWSPWFDIRILVRTVGVVARDLTRAVWR